MFNLLNWWKEVKIAHECRCNGWSRRKYDRYRDPDANMRAATIDGFYHGYPIVLDYTNPSDDLIAMMNDQDNGTWMDENLAGKFRMDVHGVQNYNGVATLVSLGALVLYVAFELESDAVLFRLRWE